MQVLSRSLAEEIRITVDAGVELANVIADGANPVLVRSMLVDHGFVRAPLAPDSAIDDVLRRFAPVAEILNAIGTVTLADVVVAINDELAATHVAPSLVVHDGAPLHIHWTSATAPFGVQVVVDVLMALAQTLCDDGLQRFGRCGADDCEHLYFDATRNHSRRFCSDARCASRTHTADHRSRRRTEKGQP